MDARIDLIDEQISLIITLNMSYCEVNKRILMEPTDTGCVVDDL